MKGSYMGDNITELNELQKDREKLAIQFISPDPHD